MAKRAIRKSRGAETGLSVVTAAATTDQNVLAAIFASIREGQTPWSIDELPADTGATTVLLSELDRLWQNPLN